MSILPNSFKNAIRQNHQNKVIQTVKQVAEDFLIGYWNESYFNMQNNGELYLIKSAKEYFKSQNIIVFDVGANHGQWSMLVKNTFPNSSIYCFEIIPKTFTKLAENCEKKEGFTLNQFGLSNINGEVEVTFFPSEDTGSSIQALPWDCPSITVTSHVVSGDQYSQENNINEIDFLKIDTEGHELAVLKGFNNLLKDGRITLIQFEYGMTYIPPRITLGDVYHLLSPYGYSIGRLHPAGVKFKLYDMFEDENFRAGNYVAVHQSAERLLKQIKL